MSHEKLSSKEVPQKFLEWLINMGCPMEIVPSIDKISQISQGHYMVWRSLMERVQPKDEIQNKRLNVFCNDLEICEKNKEYIEPKQLVLWRQQQEARQRVAMAEVRVAQARQNLNQMMDKASSKICQRDISHKRAQDKERRAHLLRSASEALVSQSSQLEETGRLAQALCCVQRGEHTEAELQNMVEACLASLQPLSNPDPSTVAARADEIEEQFASLARVRGDALWKQLMEIRAETNARLAQANTQFIATSNSKELWKAAKSALAHSRALQCTLALEALKARARARRVSEQFAAALDDEEVYENGDLFVARLEHAQAGAGARALREMLGELAANSGVFETVREGCEPVTDQQIGALNKAIENATEELQRLLLSLAGTECKTRRVAEDLAALFRSFRGPRPAQCLSGTQLNTSQDSIETIFQFYEQEICKRRNKMDLSLDSIETNSSQNISSGNLDSANVRFIDELKFYLNKFNLENNRKLILESGKNICIFETLESSLQRLNKEWLRTDVAPMLCPSVSISRNIQRIIEDMKSMEALETTLKTMRVYREPKFTLDITNMKTEEEAAEDKIKKQIADNMNTLQRTEKTLELVNENLSLWQEHAYSDYISTQRTVGGKSYKEYEAIYKESYSLYH